jgi:membrane fusion protein (multidrug efflux system)
MREIGVVTGEEESSDRASAASRARLRRFLLIAIPIVAAIIALWIYLTGGRYESTENASLQAGIVAVAASVSGKVVAVDVSENQRVTRGQVLFRIKRDDFEAAAAEAEAQLATARTEVGSIQADYQEALSQVEAAESRSVFAKSEKERQQALLTEGISSRSQYDSAIADARTAHNAVAAAWAKAESLKARLSNRIDAPAADQPMVRRAASNLTKARIALDDTVVRASQDGIVTRVHQLQVGNYVTAGRPVLVLTGTRFWVQANFKEDQLRYMRVGQPATVTIDAFPDYALKGHVASFSPGTGSSFSILPAENATGNWVKVVQRVPVQIDIDDIPAGLPLSVGMSAAVEVDTGHQRLFGSSAARAQAAPTR